MARDPNKILAAFDHTADIVRPFVTERHGAAATEAIFRDARRQLATIIPRVPTITGLRAPVFNFFLLATAEELALYLAMKAHGKTPAQAWEICNEAVKERMRRLPKWKAWAIRQLMFSPLVKLIVRRRAGKGEHHSFGNFMVRYVVGDGKNFDYGVDYLKCGNLELAKDLGAEEFAPFVCLSDIALSDALGWGLTRTQTLADGCDHCDFRFQEGTETQITSKTPAVQDAIDRM